MFYKTPRATEALIITGGFGRRSPENPFKVVVGSGAWYLPGLHRVDRFPIDARSVRFDVKAQSKDSVEINVNATAVFSVTRTRDGITRAASRFLGYSDDQIRDTAIDVFGGATRALVGSMSVQEIITDRMTLANSVVDEVKLKIVDFGWNIDSFTINEVRDDNSHIENLSRPELTRVAQQAAIAEAEAQSRIQEAQQKSEREVSEYRKATDLQTSQNTLETAEARARAEQSAPLAQAREQLAVTQEETKLQQARADLAKATYEATTIQEAEAQAKKITIEARARAEATKLESEALASSNSVMLDDKLIEQLPAIVEALGDSLRDANVTLIGKDSDVTGAVAQLATVGSEILKGIRDARNEITSQ